MDRLKKFINGIGNILTGLRTNAEFRGKLDELVALAKTPLVQSIVASFSIDLTIIDSLYVALLNDTVSSV